MSKIGFHRICVLAIFSVQIITATFSLAQTAHKGAALLNNAQEFIRKKQYDSVPRVVWKSFHHFNREGDQGQLLSSYKILAEAYENFYYTDSAVYYYQKALKLSDKLQNPPIEKAILIKKIAQLLAESGNDSEALKLCIKGLQLSENHNLKEYESFFNNQMGLIYANQENHAKAIEYHKKALEIARKSANPKDVGVSLQLIGESYLAAQNLALAETKLLEAQEIFEKNDFKKNLANVLDELGRVYFKKEAIAKALAYQTRALRVREENNFYSTLPESYVSLANSYLSLKRYDDALGITRKGIVTTRKTGATPQLKELYQQIYLIYKDLNYKDSALFYHEKFAQLRDSLDKVENDAMVIRLQNAFENERRELEIADLKKERKRQEERLIDLQKINEQNRYLRISFIIIIFFLLGFAILFYSRYRLKARSNIEITKKVNENELLLKELHHRVKNNLQFISSLLSLQSTKVEDTKAKQVLSESLQKVKAMSMLHNTLNIGNDADPNASLKEFLTSLTRSLALSYGIDGNQLKFIYNWKDASFDLDSFSSIGLVINELITNSFKHCDHDNLEVSIGFYENRSMKMIRYADNGPGLDELFFTGGRRMGITLMNLLVEDFGGKLKYSKPKTGEEGIRVSIDINKNGKHR